MCPTEHLSALRDLGSMRLLSKNVNQVVSPLFFRDILLDFGCDRATDPLLQDEEHKIQRYLMLSSSDNAIYVRNLVIGHRQGSRYEFRATNQGEKLGWYIDALASDLPTRLGLFPNLRAIRFRDWVALQSCRIVYKGIETQFFPKSHNSQQFATFVYGDEYEATNLESTMRQLHHLRIKLVNPWRTDEITTLPYTAFFNTIEMTRHLTKLKIDAASDPEIIELSQLDITHLNQLRHLSIQHIFSPAQHLVRLMKQNSTTLEYLNLQHVKLSRAGWDWVFERMLGVEVLTRFVCEANGYAKCNGRYFIPRGELMDIMGEFLDVRSMHWRDFVALGEFQRRINEIRVRQGLGLLGMSEEFMRLNEVSLEEWDMKSGT
ncbi:MAG: hypothetical protein Q9157_000105 [Trypethelium eluteriae]